MGRKRRDSGVIWSNVPGVPAFDPLGYVGGPTDAVHFGWGGAADSPGAFLVAQTHDALRQAREATMGLGTFGVGSSLNPWSLGTSSTGGGGFGAVNWGDVLIGGANVVGAYFDRKQQRKLLKAQQRAQMLAMTGGGYAYNPYVTTNPNIGGVAGNAAMTNFGLTPSGNAASGWGDLAAWQTAPVDPGGIFGASATNAGLPAVLAPGVVGGAVATAARIGGPLLRTLMKYMAPAAAAVLIDDLITNGVTAGGPYRTEGANKALAYRGDLAACKRLRKLGSAIGYARSTGARRSVRRGRRC